MNPLSKCELCERRCKIDRIKGELGFCKSPKNIKIARTSLHFYEEPCISGKNGSGTIFFSHCNLRCIFCQNYDISINQFGKEITLKHFANLCLSLQEHKAHNINLVTPTCYIPQIKKGIQKAKKLGLTIPIVYNTSSYETKEALKSLDGIIDVYLPDFKYYDNQLAIKYSQASNYQETAKKAIAEMYRQTGPILLDDTGIVQKGVIVRHLMLPTHLEDSKKIVKYLYDTYHDNIFISIMNQYTPIRHLPQEELNHTVTEKEYDELINYAYDLGIRNAFIQEGETQKESFIPDFSHYQEL